MGLKESAASHIVQNLVALVTADSLACLY